MKKISILLIISLLALNLNAQITISGSTTYPALNLTFNQSSIIPYSNCYIFSDAGTNFYKASVLVPPAGGVPGYNIDYYIIRRSNRWFIEGFNYLNPTYPSYYVYYESQNSSTDINPPCNEIWRIWSGYCVPLGGFSLTPTGTNTSTLVLSGLCASLPTKSATITPTYIQLPQLTTVQINALTPQKGMMVFDVTINVIKLYDGATWKTVSVL